MHKLSHSATLKQEQDMVDLAEGVDPVCYVQIVLVGIWFLVSQMAQKLTPNQRAALSLVTLLASGLLIALLIQDGLVGLALIVVFLAGIAIGLIARL